MIKQVQIWYWRGRAEFAIQRAEEIMSRIAAGKTKRDKFTKKRLERLNREAGICLAKVTRLQK